PENFPLAWRRRLQQMRHIRRRQLVEQVTHLSQCTRSECPVDGFQVLVGVVAHALPRLSLRQVYRVCRAFVSVVCAWGNERLVTLRQTCARTGRTALSWRPVRLHPQRER